MTPCAAATVPISPGSNQQHAHPTMKYFVESPKPTLALCQYPCLAGSSTAHRFLADHFPLSCAAPPEALPHSTTTVNLQPAAQGAALASQTGAFEQEVPTVFLSNIRRILTKKYTDIWNQTHLEQELPHPWPSFIIARNLVVQP